MAEKIGQNKKTKPSALKVATGFLLLLLLVALPVAAFMAAKRFFFGENPRFTLQRIEIDSNGFWKDNSELLCRVMELESGRENLFKLNLGELRAKAENIPCVESCEVLRIIPDSVRFKIVERIPRAALGATNSPLVIDGDGMVMSRDRAMKISTQLPVLNRSFGSALPGKKLDGARGALGILMHCIRSFPEFNVLWINREPDGKISLIIRYNARRLKAVFPPEPEDANHLLSLLQSAIISAEHSGERKTTFDLSFSGSVIHK